MMPTFRKDRSEYQSIPKEVNENSKRHLSVDGEELGDGNASPVGVNQLSGKSNQSTRSKYFWRSVLRIFSLICVAFVFPVAHRLWTRRSGNIIKPRNGVRYVNEGKISQVDGKWEHDLEKQKSATINAVTGAVATDQGICSIRGTEILEMGGNAVDSAVASALCLGVVNPASSGMGGGLFILIHMAATEDREEVNEVIDGRETAPAAATFDMYDDLPPSASLDGGLAIAVLGELKGLELAHKRHGVLPWATVVEPAAKLAEDGVAVNVDLAAAISRNTDKLIQNPGLSKLLSKEGDGKTWLKEGDVFFQPQLGLTLRKIMEEGSGAIYDSDSELAQGLVQDIKDDGGIITLDDLSNYSAVIREPIQADVGGFSILGAPPPSSGGGAVISIIRFLLGYQTPYATFFRTLSQHRFVEAMKHAFAIRMSLSDPLWNTETVNRAVSDLTQGNYVDYLRNMTSDTSTLPLSFYGGSTWALLKDINSTTANSPPKFKANGSRYRRSTRGLQYLEDSGTSHLSVVDKDRNAVSLTSTINTEFGSGLLSPSTGILLNNEMDDFATPGRPNTYGLAPAKSNYIAPGKRPLSSMSPTMVFFSENEDGKNFEGFRNHLGKLFLVVGASGGPRIISATTQVILNHAMKGLSLAESMTHARVHDQLLYKGAPWTNCDEGQVDLPSDTREALLSRGHKLFPLTYMGAVQAVSVNIENDSLVASSDIRKGGQPCGY